ncbi:MAG: lipopolysaccharide assembly protein LapA domain-containing protein [Pseudonocardia sp.]|nr:lipopolysaccharide assembly protein LapA domain-containing protein [Pseudonocardia sp.]
MSEDPTRATRSSDGPPYGSVGPQDPHADPATDPGMRPVGPATDPSGRTVAVPSDPTDPETAPVPTTPVRPDPVVTRTRTGGLWTGLILSAIVGIFLLVFILQNDTPIRINFLGFSGTLPTGVALLLAAIAGLLLVAIPGGLRILQLRRAAKRASR